MCNYLVILVTGALETYSNDSSRLHKKTRKGYAVYYAVSPLSFFCLCSQHSSTRAARSGDICIRVKREEMKEVLHINRPLLTVREIFHFS